MRGVQGCQRISMGIVESRGAEVLLRGKNPEQLAGFLFAGFARGGMLAQDLAENFEIAGTHAVPRVSV